MERLAKTTLTILAILSVVLSYFAFFYTYKKRIYIDSIHTNCKSYYLAEFSCNDYDGDTERWEELASAVYVLRTVDGQVISSNHKGFKDIISAKPKKRAYFSRMNHFNHFSYRQVLKINVFSEDEIYQCKYDTYKKLINVIGDSVTVEMYINKRIKKAL